MAKTSASTLDFLSYAKKYDQWYKTPMGDECNHEEKAAVLEFLHLGKPGERLLDVGCGTGHWSRFFFVSRL